LYETTKVLWKKRAQNKTFSKNNHKKIDKNNDPKNTKTSYVLPLDN